MVTRILCRSHLLYDLDSVNFALGMTRFDPVAHQPHPPGYFLYVCLARLVNRFLTDPNTALVAIGIAASCGAAWVIYLLTWKWFGPGAARMSILLFLASPLGWFHGTVALTYMVEAFFSALIGYLCWRAYSGERAFVLPATIAFALAAGFRPSTALLLAPLWLFSIRRVRGIRLGLAIAAAIAVTLAWFLPMTAAAGGFRSYFEALVHLWSTVPGQRTTLSSPWLAVGRILTMAWIFVLVFGSASVFAFWPKAKTEPGQPRRAGFVWAWIAPGMFFFAFVFLNFINSGYLLLLCPPLFALAAARLYAFVSPGDRSFLRWTAVTAGIAANCAVFFFAPLYCSYKSVRGFETNLTAIVQDFGGNLDSGKTLIVGFDSHFLGYRHAGYYLPHFVTVQYPEIAYPGGKRVFVMHERSTEVVGRLPAGHFERFVFFPLPDGAEYTTYLDTVQSKLPRGALTTVVIGSRKVLTGPVSLLPLLFPETAR
jgi:4-amino-4-deoxy-L-arabinose transferase-like glycosyltransferase